MLLRSVYVFRTSISDASVYSKNTIEIVHKHIPVSRKEVYFIGISIVSVVLFSMFNMKYAFLGDGLLRLDNVVKNKILLNESGTIFIMHLFYSAAHNVFSLNDSALLKLFSNMCGGLFIYTTLHIADLLGKSVFEKIAFFYNVCPLWYPSAFLRICGSVCIVGVTYHGISLHIHTLPEGKNTLGCSVVCFYTIALVSSCYPVYCTITGVCPLYGKIQPLPVS